MDSRLSPFPNLRKGITKSILLFTLIVINLKGQAQNQYLQVLSPWDKEFVEEQMPVILDLGKRDIQPPNNLVLEWDNIDLFRLDSLTTILNIKQIAHWWGGEPLANLNLEFCIIKSPRYGRYGSEARGPIGFDVIGVYYSFTGSEWEYLPVGTKIPTVPFYFNQVGFEGEQCDQPELYLSKTYVGDYRDRNFENLFVFNLLYTHGYFGFRDQAESQMGLYEELTSKNGENHTYDYSLEFNEEIVKELNSPRFIDLAWKCFTSYSPTYEQLFDNPISIEWDVEAQNSYYSEKKNKGVVKIQQYTPYWKFCESPPFMALPIIGKLDSLVYGHLVVYPKWNNMNRYSSFHTIVLNPYSHSFMDYPLQASSNKELSSYSGYSQQDIRDGFFRYFFFQDVLYPALNTIDKLTKERKHFNNSSNLKEKLDTLWSDARIELNQIAVRGIQRTQHNINYGLITGKDDTRIHYAKNLKRIYYTPTFSAPSKFTEIHHSAYRKAISKEGLRRIGGYDGIDLTCDSLIQKTDMVVSEAINLISEFYGPVIPIGSRLETLNDALPTLSNKYDLERELRQYENFKGQNFEQVMEEVIDIIPELDSLRIKIDIAHKAIEDVAEILHTVRYYSAEEIDSAFNQWALYYRGLTLGQKKKLKNQLSDVRVMQSQFQWKFHNDYFHYNDRKAKSYLSTKMLDCEILFFNNGEVILKTDGNGHFPRIFDLSTLFPRLKS